jgi:hypothetical protein
VNAENSAVDHGAQSEKVKNLATPSPHVAAPVFPLTFVVEAVDLRDLPRLVVPADERDSFWVPDFEREEQNERLDAVKSSINEIACKRRKRIWRSSVNRPK